MNFETVKAIVYEKIHHQPFGTDEIVNIHSIIIPNEFKTKESRPSKKKMILHRQEFLAKGFLDKPIEVRSRLDKTGIFEELYLVDKYCRLCIAFEFGMDQVPVKYIV